MTAEERPNWTEVEYPKGRPSFTATEVLEDLTQSERVARKPWTAADAGVTFAEAAAGTERLAKAMAGLADAAKRFDRIFAAFRRAWNALCVRCRTRDRDLTGVNPSLCASCEHRAATRTIAALLTVMALLSVAMITLGRIG